MMRLQFWILIVSWIQTGILCQSSCGDKQTVIGTEGGDVLLSVHQTGVEEVTWVSVNGINHFATTGPGGFLRIRDNRYKDRLNGTTNGSLNLTKLTREDQGEYRGSILRNPGNTLCDQLYNLTVFRRLSEKDIGITLVNVTSNGTCAVALLCAVNGSGVTISWRRSHDREISGINDFLHVPDTETNHSFTCIAQNPVSNASRTVTPREYCQPGTNNSSSSSPGNTALYVALPSCGIIAVVVLYFARRRERNKTRQNEMQLLPNTTIYAEVNKPQTQNLNPYQVETEKETTATINTLYSEVQLPKNLPGGNGVCAQPDQREINTLYSEVQQVKNPPHKKEECVVYDTIKK
uniref:Ig-like domain-containing protein n=1 Tax=Leptobrachium leishanense TaxID=445787 RepID=A0A8C5WK97_9ANUR